MSIAVAILTGRSRVFCSRPPIQKMVLPAKYSWFLPNSLLTTSFDGSLRASRGEDSADVSFSWPWLGRIWVERPSRLDSKKLERNERGDLLGVGSFPESLAWMFVRLRCWGRGRCRGVMLSSRLRTVSAPVGVELAVVRSGMSLSVMSVPRDGGG